MLNRRGLIAGLGALCTIPFLPKFSHAKEFYDGKEVIRIEIDSREFYYRRNVRGMMFSRSVKMTESRKTETPAKLIEYHIFPEHYEGLKYIFVVSHGEYAYIFGSETNDVRIVEDKGFQQKRVVFPHIKNRMELREILKGKSYDQ